MNKVETIADVPLVVDMDGTLLRTDTLHEAMLAFVRDDPLRAWRLIPWLRSGRAEFKRRLGDEVFLDPESLPVNQSVLQHIRDARAAGREVVLVSAADHRQVEAVAKSLGVFTGWHGSDDGTNLKGSAKANFLVERYGAGGFDYVGDSMADVAVWSKARNAITASAPSRVREAAEKASGSTRHLDAGPGGAKRVRPYLRAMRPYQWVKNVLVFVPMLAAHDVAAFGAAIAAFIAFSLTASSVYLMNDLLDLAADRAHPRKRRRPMAAGEVPVLNAAVLAACLFLASVAIAFLFAPLLFVGVLFVYFATTCAYSLVLKRKLVIDVWALASLYTLRILAGAAATSVALSPWILAFSMFLFLSLAAVKRQAELTDQIKQGKTEASGRAYLTDDLPVLRGIALSAGYAAVLVFALYINNPSVEALYPAYQLLWAVPPVLLYWVSRMVMVTHRGDMHDDPILFAARDRQSQVCILLCIAAMAAATAIGPH